MKSTILYLFFIALFIQGCKAQDYKNTEITKKWIDTKEFTFHAERVTTMNADVMNVINSLPNSSYSRMQELDQGYSVVIKTDSLDVYLPYFGRVFNTNRSSTDNGIKFLSTDFSMKVKDGKKGAIIYEIKPMDYKKINVLYLEVMSNGKAYLSINSNDRQPISYQGRVTKNEDVK